MTDAVIDGGVSRAKGINKALKMCSLGDWVIVTDADILFTTELINFIRQAPLKTHEIYGARRIFASNIEDLERFFFNGDVSCLAKNDRDNVIWDVPQLGAGVQGCFQLFNYAGQYYPEDFDVAGNEDRIFSKWWPIGQRHQLPLPIIHLGPAFVNWFTRVSENFGYSEKLFKFLQTHFSPRLTVERIKEMIMTDMTQVDRLKVDLFDLMEKQGYLQSELQKVEQVKQQKLKELAVCRQQQSAPPAATVEGLMPLANSLVPKV